MGVCDCCQEEGNMPVHVMRDTGEQTLEKWFCSEICLERFFHEVNTV